MLVEDDREVEVKESSSPDDACEEQDHQQRHQ